MSEALEFSLVFETVSASEENEEPYEEDSEDHFVLESNDDESSSEVVCRTVITML